MPASIERYPEGSRANLPSVPSRWPYIMLSHTRLIYSSSNHFYTLSILRPCLTHKRDRMTFRQDLEEILRMDNSGALTSHLPREYSRLQFKFAYNQTIKGGYYAALGCL